jgi:integrase/recombinase XerD
LESRIRARHKPARQTQPQIIQRVVGSGLSLIEKATVLLHRDGLMVALLALVPLRRRNFAALRLDRNVVVINDSWLITLDESETKTHAPLEIMWPEELRRSAPISTTAVVGDQ